MRERTAWVLPTPELVLSAEEKTLEVMMGLEIRASQPQSPTSRRCDQYTALHRPVRPRGPLPPTVT